MLKILYRIPFSPVVKACVYKLLYDGRYVIIKAMEIENSATKIQKSINQDMREMAGQRKPDNLYAHLYKYVEENPEKEFKYEILLESESAYQLLVAEQKALNKARKDSKCLNNNTEA